MSLFPALGFTEGPVNPVLADARRGRRGVSWVLVLLALNLRVKGGRFVGESALGPRRGYSTPLHFGDGVPV
jgi:hypothetical protein